MSYPPGAAYYAEFTTSNPSTAAAQTADSLPVATANHNGVDDATFALTVTLLDVGRYKITGTVPSAYVVGDRVWISVVATVTGAAGPVTGKGPVDDFAVALAWGGIFTDAQVGVLLRAVGAATAGDVLSNVDGTLQNFQDALDPTTTRIIATNAPLPPPGTIGVAPVRTVVIS